MLIILHLYFVHLDTLYAIIGALVGIIAMLFFAVILAIFFVTRCIRRQRLRGTHSLQCFIYLVAPIMLKGRISDTNFFN